MNFDKYLNKIKQTRYNQIPERIRYIQEYFNEQIAEIIITGLKKYSIRDIALRTRRSHTTIRRHVKEYIDFIIRKEKGKNDRRIIEIYDLIFGKRTIFSYAQLLCEKARLFLLTRRREFKKISPNSHNRYLVWCGNRLHKPTRKNIRQIRNIITKGIERCRMCSNNKIYPINMEIAIQIGLEFGYILNETPKSFWAKYEEGIKNRLKSSLIKFDWYCENNHSIKKALDRIKYSGCKECFDTDRIIKHSQVRKVGAQKGYMLNMTPYEFQKTIDRGRAKKIKSHRMVLRWSCINSHIWETSYAVIYQTLRKGTCPDCYDDSMGEPKGVRINEANFNNFKQLKTTNNKPSFLKFYLKYVRNLHKVLRQDFPNFILNNIKEYPRVSEFDNKLTKIDKKTKEEFIDHFREKYVVLINLPIKGKNKLDKFDKLVLKAILELIEYSQNEYYNQNQLWSVWPKHGFVTSRILYKSKYAVASETPIWIYSDTEQKYLTGHVDLIMIIDGVVYVCDFKPNYSNNTKPASKNFINSIPQVAIYGLIIKKNFNIENLYCITFNKESAWVYNPCTVINEVTKFLHRHNQNIKQSWEVYI
ncbi:MAG: helix-turn-helix domain-containing protein [Candidatus Lokiarchaeota archaeon]|nr:helix-turn-helix domain-containing protein [Candidatus Lokiarchaeota archaeon]